MKVLRYLAAIDLVPVSPHSPLCETTLTVEEVNPSYLSALPTCLAVDVVKGVHQVLYAVKSCLCLFQMRKNMDSFHTSIESPENTFPCSQNVNINELQFCDGTVDCPNAADEPTGCPSGTYMYTVKLLQCNKSKYCPLQIIIQNAIMVK